MSGTKSFLAGFALAAALAAAGWFLRVAPERAADRRAVADSAEGLRAARREAADNALLATSERGRNTELEIRVRELETQLTARVPTGLTDPNAGTDPNGMRVHAPAPDEPPETWDRQRINQEFENVAAAGPAVPQHPRLPLLARAIKAQKERGVSLISQIIAEDAMPAEFMVTAALVAQDVGDPALVAPLFARWKQEKDADVRLALIRALSALPGDQIVPGLIAVWNDPQSGIQARGAAIEGLARRGIDMAYEVVLGGTAREGTPDAKADPRMRLRGLVGLRDRAEATEWKDELLLTLFGRCLATADGDGQRRISMIALEGYWNAAAAKQLLAFASDPAAPPALAIRAKKSSEAITAGDPRPEGAGRLDAGARKAE